MKSWAEWEQALRLAHIKELAANIEAEQLVYAPTFLGFLAFTEERFLTSDALDELRDARLRFQEVLTEHAPGAGAVGPVGVLPLDARVAELLAGLDGADLVSAVDRAAHTAAPVESVEGEVCDECSGAMQRLVDARAEVERVRAASPDDHSANRTAQNALESRRWELEICVELLCRDRGSHDIESCGLAVEASDRASHLYEVVAACSECQTIANEIARTRAMRDDVGRRIDAVERSAQQLEALGREIDSLRHERNLVHIELSSARQAFADLPIGGPAAAARRSQIIELMSEYRGLTSDINDRIEHRERVELELRALPLLRDERRELEQRGLYLEELLAACEEERCAGQPLAWAPTDLLEIPEEVANFEFDDTETDTEESRGRGCLIPALVGTFVAAALGGVGLFVLSGDGDDAADSAPPVEDQVENEQDPPAPAGAVEPENAVDPVDEQAEGGGEPTPPDLPPVVLPDVADGLPLFSGIDPSDVVVIIDENGDVVFSRSSETPEARGGEDIGEVAAVIATAGASAALDVLDGSAFPCGAQTDEYRVTCQVGAGPAGAGELLIVAMQLDAMAPNLGTAYAYNLGVDSDGNPADNYMAPPEFDWDFAQGAEQLWRLVVEPDGTRRMWAEAWVEDIPGVPFYTAAAFVEFEERVMWLVPLSELEGDDVRIRTTAFANDGTPGAVPTAGSSAGDVLGEDPTSALFEVPRPASPSDVTLDRERWPDVETVIPRVTPEDGDFEQQFLQSAFAELGGRLNEVLAAGGGTDQVLALLHPVSIGQFGEDACRAAIEATIGQADSITFEGPVVPSPGAPFPIFQGDATISYPTGDVPSPFAAAVIGDGRFHLLFNCG